MNAVHQLRCKFHPDLVFNYCVENGLIGKTKTCTCGGDMTLQKYCQAIDGYAFRCNQCDCTKSVRV
uniref:Uncharacterized protein n=1 Tax=Trichobilharzia regenti TaxID=157069 RepID=A0AA85IMT6_TRIRE